MSRKITLEGAQKRLEIVRTAVYNLERDLHLAGEDIKPFVEFSPEDVDHRSFTTEELSHIPRVRPNPRAVDRKNEVNSNRLS